MKRVGLFVGWMVALCVGPLMPSGAAVVTTMNVTGTVNATSVTATGSIVGDSAVGQYSGNINFTNTVANWELFSLYELSVSVDRCFSEEVDIGFGFGINFDTLNDCNFTFNRSVTFQGAALVGTATFAGQMTRTSPGTIDLTGNWVASGDWTAFGTITSVAPYLEYFQPAGPGQVTSFMIIPYVMSTGDEVMAETTTTYSFDPLFELQSKQLATRSLGFSSNNNQDFTLNFSGSVTTTPEPSTMIIMGLGVSLGFVGRRWRARKAQQRT